MNSKPNFRHARKYISTFEDTRMDEVQQCMVLLAFPTDTGKLNFFLYLIFNFKLE